MFGLLKAKPARRSANAVPRGRIRLAQADKVQMTSQLLASGIQQADVTCSAVSYSRFVGFLLARFTSLTGQTPTNDYRTNWLANRLVPVQARLLFVPRSTGVF